MWNWTEVTNAAMIELVGDYVEETLEILLKSVRPTRTRQTPTNANRSMQYAQSCCGVDLNTQAHTPNIHIRSSRVSLRRICRYRRLFVRQYFPNKIWASYLLPTYLIVVRIEISYKSVGRWFAFILIYLIERFLGVFSQKWRHYWTDSWLMRHIFIGAKPYKCLL